MVVAMIDVNAILRRRPQNIVYFSMAYPFEHVHD